MLKSSTGFGWSCRCGNVNSGSSVFCEKCLFPKLITTNTSTATVKTLYASHVYDSCTFAAQEECHVNIIKLVTEKLETFARHGTGITGKPNKNLVYAAKYPGDGQWHRCSVTKFIDNLNSQITFIDYGSSDTVQNNQLLLLPDELQNVPALCERYKLLDVQASSSSTLEQELGRVWLSKLLHGKVIKALARKEKNGRVWVADCMVDNKRLSSEVLASKFAVPYTQRVAKPSDAKDQNNGGKVKNMSQDSKDGYEKYLKVKPDKNNKSKKAKPAVAKGENATPDTKQKTQPIGVIKMQKSLSLGSKPAEISKKSPMLKSSQQLQNGQDLNKSAKSRPRSKGKMAKNKVSMTSSKKNVKPKKLQKKKQIVGQQNTNEVDVAFDFMKLNELIKPSDAAQRKKKDSKDVNVEAETKPAEQKAAASKVATDAKDDFDDLVANVYKSLVKPANHIERSHEDIETALNVVSSSDYRPSSDLDDALKEVKQRLQKLKEAQHKITLLTQSEISEDVISKRDELKRDAVEAFTKYEEMCTTWQLKNKVDTVHNVHKQITTNFPNLENKSPSQQDLKALVNTYHTSNEALKQEAAFFQEQTEASRLTVIEAFKEMSLLFENPSEDATIPQPKVALNKLKQNIEAQMQFISNQSKCREDVKSLAFALQTFLSAKRMELGKYYHSLENYKVAFPKIKKFLEEKPNLEEYLSLDKEAKSVKSKLRRTCVDLMDLEDECKDLEEKQPVIDNLKELKYTLLQLLQDKKEAGAKLLEASEEYPELKTTLSSLEISSEEIINLDPTDVSWLKSELKEKLPDLDVEIDERKPLPQRSRKTNN